MCEDFFGMYGNVVMCENVILFVFNFFLLDKIFIFVCADRVLSDLFGGNLTVDRFKYSLRFLCLW